MRAIIELFENLINGVRIIVGLIVLAIMALGLMLSYGVSTIGAASADSAAASIENAGVRVVKARERQRIAEDMAKDGWSYGAVSASTDPQSAEDGWGD